LGEFTKLFVQEGINIVGIASEIRDDSGVVRITIDSEKRMGYIFTQAGFITVETTILSVELGNQPGELHKVAKILGENGINITTVYGTASGENGSRIVMSVNDPEKAAKILEKEFN